MSGITIISLSFIACQPLILEPSNAMLGNRSLARYVAKGDWRPVLSLWVGCLICGFFWEMWNYYSYPKWVYRVPFVGFLRVFEMPLLGYGGYLPFSLELYALYHLITGLSGRGKTSVYVQVSPDETELTQGLGATGIVH